jgi:hypothetical protein
MDDNKLIKHSALLHKEADTVIVKVDFVKLFSQLGTISFVGSYVLDLMYRRDIDVFVQSTVCTRSRADLITNELVKSNLLQTIGYADWTEQKAPNGLYGFYWQLIYYLKGHKWKFDVWYTNEVVRTIPICNEIKERLTQVSDAKLKILRLKDKFYDGETYRDGMSGFKIYESVIGTLNN